MHKRLLLFDIDGTLMHSGGAGARALTRALFEVFGLKDALAGVRLNGQTDPQIVTDALSRAGLLADDERRTQLEALYLTYLAREIVTSERACLMPGVHALLDHLAGRCDVILGLLSGNIEPGARIKLSRFDLNRYFSCGGFGSDSHVRRDLVPIALERARHLHGVRLTPKDVVVVGDTERDVDCGRHAGARTLAVATGCVAESVLREAGPDMFFANLADTERVAAALLEC
jgi:phosphoglycolate phosphatase-like HAD superfamily hydrolase